MAKRLPDLFGAGEVRTLRLEAATGLLALAVVLLVGLLLWQRLSGLPVCYGTAEAAHDRVAQLFHPQLLNIFQARAERERAMMQTEDLSTQLSIRNTVTGRSGGAYAARIDAVRRVFAGTLPIRDEELGVTVRWQRVQPSPLNPWGLAIIGLEFSEPLRAETG